MCGICGIAHRDLNQPVDPALVERMNSMIIHRGPDEHGSFVEGNVGLAMRRLSIIDLASGRQPMTNEDGRLVCVYNGEIYNYLDLREELIGRGHTFKTNSDTEVIVHAYEEFGEECVKRFRGMFAFALWDRREKKLFLAIDRFGIKPLHYVIDNEGIIFGSEIKSLLETGRVDRSIDSTALGHYLKLGYVPPPWSIFSNVRKLRPGSYIVWDGKDLKEEIYWDLETEVDREVDYETWERRVEEILSDSVCMRLQSEVPLGILLSGGIDSGLMTALASLNHQGRVSTLTATLKGYSAYDESDMARKVAQRYETQHQEVAITPDVLADLPQIVRAFDEPFADSSAIPNFYIFKAAKPEATVVLTGLGGDETFAGYERYLGCLLAEPYNRFPSAPKNILIKPIVSRLPDSETGSLFLERVRRFVRAADKPLPDRYFDFLPSFDDEAKEAVAAPDGESPFRPTETREYFRSIFAETEQSDPLSRLLHIDVKTYLPGDLLTLTDRMSMTHSVEARVPFLDHKVVELAATIPREVKMKWMRKKYLLRHVARNFLPKPIVRGKKKGFSVPLGSWLRTQLKEFMQDMLSRDAVKAAGVFNPDKVETLVRAHLDRKADFQHELWTLIMFQAWHGQYITQRP